MNTNKTVDNKQKDRFRVYKIERYPDELGGWNEDEQNKWVIDDTETSNILYFSEGKVKTDGFFASFKDGKVITDCRLVGQTIREMNEFLEENYKHLIY